MEPVRGMVRSIRGNTLLVAVESRVYRCVFRGKVKRQRKASRKVAAVGDEVTLLPQADNEGIIEEVLPRRNSLSRPDVQHRWREQVIVANVDRMIVVHSLKEPDLDLLTIDKCLVMGAACDIPTALAVTKTDLADPPDLSFYEAAGVPVYLLSSTDGTGVEKVAESLPSRTTVLMGPSGVGKSTLLNALDPELKLKVGEVSERTGWGKHTTTWVEIIDLRGGRVVDTPGLENFDFWKLSVGNLPACFPEFDDYTCRFRNCAHDKEPDCGVKVALKEGKISQCRYDNYLAIRKILKEKGVAFPGAAPAKKPSATQEKPPSVPPEYR